MKSISAALAAHLQQDVTTLASCWKITRQDGVIMGFTDHDRELVIDGITFVASSGYLRSAIANSATAAVDNLQVHGFLDDDSISEEELRNGAYDFATVEVFIVNWYDLTQGILRSRYGLFGEVQIFPSGLFAVELRGLTQMLSQTIGEVYAPECRADLGDSRCKVKLIPDPRFDNTSYVVGDRVVIPHDAAETTINIPLVNGDFEIPYRWPLAWTPTNYVRGAPTSLGGITPQSGAGLAEPFSRSGKLYRLWVLQGGATTVHASISQYQIASGSTLKMSFRFSSGFGEGTEISTVEALAAAETSIGSWTTRTSADIAIPVGATKIEAFIEWNGPDGIAAQVLFDTFVLTTDVGQLSGDLNDSFDNVSGEGNLSFGWLSAVALINSTATLNLTPYSGNHYVIPASNDVVPGSAQTEFPYSLITGSITTANIDAGDYELVLNGAIGAEESGWQGGIDLTFYNASGAAIVGKNVTIPKQTIIPPGAWQYKTAIGAIPSGARSFSISLQWDVDQWNNNNRPRVAFDDISVGVRKAGLDLNDIRRYAGIEFVCTTPGTSGIMPPSVIGIAIGNAVSDGTVIWQAEYPKYTFLATVGTVADNTQFELPDLNVPDNFVQFGVIKFLTGINKGRAMEVGSWDNTSKIAIAALPFFYIPTAGDVVIVHAGCDKSRAMCWDKFQNIINMRGEPDIPGNDQYFHLGRNI